ncbi:class I SAM-dependent methyltransferase [Phragmitibacter flavus]|uniref:Class I SAM-dependent methyltransferase n=1 Tax=Phragmitibacter flavus TaxID=2576071 RepID=A0A5R8KEP8_9BACT|nr:class I SAM-dependent methyltransferase [Phragmitibacter flavus]TLD70069.1 class I SAM-dependent methyltransferase [Phragmitibacter flavus]
MFWRISRSLERYIRNILPQQIAPDRILEFGPGRSTRVFAETFPQALITSLEHQEPYYLKHKLKLQDLPQVTLYHCPLDHNSNSFYSTGLWSHSSYDLILVDGPPKNTKPKVRGGASCIFNNLTPGGLIILDDSNRPDEKSIIQQWIPDFDLTEIFNGSSFTVLQKSPSVSTARTRAQAEAEAEPAYMLGAA